VISATDEQPASAMACSTVVIDPQGVVRKVFSKVKVAGHVDAVLAAIAELRKA
jgi:peroxiredoxin